MLEMLDRALEMLELRKLKKLELNFWARAARKKLIFVLIVMPIY